MNNLIGGIIALLLIGGFGFYVYHDRSSSQIFKISSTTPQGELVVSPTSSSTVTATLAASKQKMPDLNRPIIFTTYPEEARELMRQKIAELVAALKKDPADFSSWVNLGLRRREIGDAEGAREAWMYANSLKPNFDVPLFNLGVLYHYDLKNYPKAEESFLSALAENSANAQTYAELSDLYRYSYKQNTAAAVTILKQGLAATQNNINLLIKLAEYYRDAAHDNMNAKLYFGQARDVAKVAGDTKTAAALDAEITALQ